MGVHSNRNTVSSKSHFERKYHGQEFLIADLDDTVPVEVLVSERRGQRLQNDAKLDEVVKVDTASVRPIELVHEDSVERRRESSTESSQCVGQLSPVDVARSVVVKAAEARRPVVHVVPQRLEFAEFDGAVTIGVEHS
ncbi:hypothetical protein PFISCL1PPCAC_22917, partial [Pristionchus fissidentatus]